MIIQIYEIQTQQEAQALMDLGVDHIGSVLLPSQDRKNPQLKATIDCVRDAGAVSSLIPLFSRPQPVLEALAYYQPAVVHFCDALPLNGRSEERLQELVALQRRVRREFPAIRVMRSIPVAPPGQAACCPTLALARRFEAASDYFLTDTLLCDKDGPESSQPVDGFIGITGTICDWQMARRLVAASSVPVILAGGIGPHNVYDAVMAVEPWGVDSCTQTNLRDEKGCSIRFKKDLRRVAQLVSETRYAEEQLAARGAGRFGSGH